MKGDPREISYASPRIENFSLFLFNFKIVERERERETSDAKLSIRDTTV